MLERTLEINRLFDFYGPLLTEKQRFVIEQYFQKDWSLAEIATELDCSRQAIHDKIGRSCAKLREYEQLLGLRGRHEKRRRILIELRDNLQDPVDVSEMRKLLSVLLEE